MRSSCVLVCIAGCFTGVVTSYSARAAIVIPEPTGPGTVQVDEAGNRVGITPGWEASGAIGTGFSDTYGLGVGGRVGYTLPVAIYLGGQMQAYWGEKVGGNTAHATFVGGELGYKYFPINELELRPYVFGGPAFITQVNSNSTVESRTGFAVQPGAVVNYHLGPAFIGVDSHLMTTPTPFGVALLGTAGANL